MSKQTTERTFHSFAEFYPYYLEEHSSPACRGLHYAGSMLALTLLGYSIATSQYTLLFFLPVVGYGFAWIGHFVFEKNKPATFKYPLYSFLGDWVMLKDFFLGHFRK